MAEGFMAATANNILNLIFRGTAWTPPSAVYLQLHIGAPGAAGTSNVATETDRIQITSGSNASAGAISNTVALTWTNVAGSEDYTHYTIWDAATAGTCLLSGTVTANAVVAGNTFVIGIGDLDHSVPIAS